MLLQMNYLIFFTSLFMAALGLCCCMRVSSPHEQRLLSCRGVWASRCSGCLCRRARAPGCAWASVVAALGRSCREARGILLDQEIEPMSPALTGRFLTTGPPGTSHELFSYFHFWIAHWYCVEVLILICQSYVLKLLNLFISSNRFWAFCFFPRCSPCIRSCYLQVETVSLLFFFQFGCASLSCGTRNL